MTILGTTCQRDDGPYLLEWLAHHLAAGFEHMLVLSHDCADGSDALLTALAHDPRITHVPFTPRGAKAVQWQALKRIGEHPLYTSAEWALFFDCDEFLCGPDASLSPLPEILAALEVDAGAFDALTLPWRLFGSAGRETRSETLTPETFLAAAPDDLHFPLAHLFKTLHRPDAFQRPGVHRPRAKPAKPARWLGPDGAPLPEALASREAWISLYGVRCGARKLWLNHYSLRSRDEFMVKRARGLPNHQTRELSLTYWVERNWNTVEEKAILPMMEATREHMRALMALPGVADADAACRAWHAGRHAEIMQDIDELRFAFRLGLAPGSRPPTPEEGNRFLRAQTELLRRGGR